MKDADVINRPDLSEGGLSRIWGTLVAMISIGHEVEAVNALRSLTSQHQGIAGSDGELRTAYRRAQEQDRQTLVRGLKGRGNDGFVELAAKSLGVDLEHS
jgi:hypothetical protein